MTSTLRHSYGNAGDRGVVAPDRTEHWSRRGLCRTNPDAWTNLDGAANATVHASVAACRRCPVRRDCLTEYRGKIGTAHRYVSVIIAGRILDLHGIPRRRHNGGGPGAAA